MKKEFIRKIIIITLLFINLLLVTFLDNNSQSLAFERVDDNIIEEKEIVQISTIQQRFYAKFNPDDYEISNIDSVTGASKLATIGNDIIKVIRTIGSAVSVIVLMIIAIKYMMGSIEEKAQYKKSMMPYVVGCLLVFGITNILAIIMKLVTNAL